VGSPFVPTRLIDVQHSTSSGKGDGCKLVVTAEMRVQEPYATLSHCWGGLSTITKLMASTLEEMKSGISISELPQTFQDAIVIKRSLHVHYLWIDSLFIMQDSLSDWSIEASMMKSIYANSTCTIAATWGSSSHTGCFVERDPNMIMPCKIVPRWTGMGAEDNPPPPGLGAR
jgi:hypothetical protein